MNLRPPVAVNGASLPEVHSSVDTLHPSIWRRLFAFAGPAYLVSVGYMDPGNWATDLEGGARFGYQLLWVLVLSNLMAILLQTLSSRLGIVASRDLAQACREAYPKPVSYALWGLCEIAIAACDLAEVLGAAIALNLLFHISLLHGVFLTAADTLLILLFTRLGIRVMESIILALIAIVAGCFLIEILWAHPVISTLAGGLVPKLSNQSLYVAIAILGATVMPHNLYLHSALVQTRRIGDTIREKAIACRYNLVDSVIALNAAMLVNCAILVLAATVFFSRGIIVTEIQQAHLLLVPLLGAGGAGVIFAVALLASGQSSTLTGTMAGQIVMEGFLNFRMRPWLRRLMTRSMAVIPAAITVSIAGDHGTYTLLLLSQVVLSMQLPFAIIPLIHFTSDRARMGVFTNRAWLKGLSWAVAAAIVFLNVRLAGMALADWLGNAPSLWLRALLFGFVSLLGVLLLWITFEPVLPAWLRRKERETLDLPHEVALALPPVAYRKILVPLDHTGRDRAAIAHAAGMARLHNARLYLLHVEEDVTSQVYGAIAETAEVLAGRSYLAEIEKSLETQGVEVEGVVRYSKTPRQEIVDYAHELQPDLIVMGAHGHSGLKDLVFGTTINAVRHQLKIPLLVVRDNGSG